MIKIVYKMHKIVIFSLIQYVYTTKNLNTGTALSDQR